jgi:TolB-like protein
MGRNSCTWAIRYSSVLFLAAALAIAPGLAGAQQAGGAKPAAPSAPKPAVPAPSAAKASSSRDMVAVLDLDAVGASKVEASAMTDRLREELLRTGKFTLVDRSQMQAVLDEQALQQTGCTTQECAVQVGKVLGVKKIVSGRVTKIADTQWLLSAQIVDVETAETLRAESLRFRGDYFSMLDEGIVTLVAKLSLPTGAKPDLAGQLAAQQQAQQAPIAAQPAEEKKSSSLWWWIVGGLVIAGVAVAASGGGGSSPKKSDTPPASTAPTSCTSNCSTVSYSW